MHCIHVQPVVQIIDHWLDLPLNLDFLHKNIEKKKHQKCRLPFSDVGSLEWGSKAGIPNSELSLSTSSWLGALKFSTVFQNMLKSYRWSLNSNLNGLISALQYLASPGGCFYNFLLFLDTYNKKEQAYPLYPWDVRIRIRCNPKLESWLQNFGIACIEMTNLSEN